MTKRYSVPRTWQRWTEQDDALVVAHYPNVEVLCSLLPDRSLDAVRFRCRQLGFTPKLAPWTTSEDRTLRRLRAEGATLAEIAAALPGRTTQAIEARCKAYGYKRQRPPARVDVGALGSVRQRAFSLGMTMGDLDRLARTGRYFYGGSRPVVMRHVSRAAKALGGWIDVEWEPLD